MKFKYIPETDTFYLLFSNNKSVESEEIADGIIADFDENNALVGIEVISAKSKIDFNELVFDSMPFDNVNFKKSSA